jgi:DNA-directed RNA polymerase subunit RPC12/RpoP
MAQNINLYQCHRCSSEWTAQSEVLQADDCANCGQGNVIPMSEHTQECDERDVGPMDIDAGDGDFDSESPLGVVEDDWIQT